MGERDWLDSQHAIYAANRDRWLRDERRLYGGDAVLPELALFPQEALGGTAYRARQAQAVYLNFPQEHAARVVGHLRRQAPTPGKGLSFGTMGAIRTRETINARPSLAELIYYNVDGVGSDGSQWPAWWDSVHMRGKATGHRWIFVEAPRQRPQSRADVLRGLRPYLVEISPLHVPNWHYVEGELDFAIVRTPMRDPRVVDGVLVGNDPELRYLLLTRAGCTRFGPDYAGGGWWLFDAKKQPVDGAAGRWEKTAGRIPFFPFVVEPSHGVEGRSAVDGLEEIAAIPAMSRSQTMELGQIAVGLMNLISARDFDAWDAAKSVLFILGVDVAAFELAAAKYVEGAVLIPVRGVQTGEGKESVPSIHDGSTGAVAGEVFRNIVEAKLAEAREIMLRQMTGTPDASGASKAAGFSESNSPTLALEAQRREQAENTAIFFLEQRCGAATPSGYVTWPTEFDLTPVADAIDRTLERMRLMAVSSPTLVAQLLERGADDDGLVREDTRETVRAELLESAQAASATSTAGATLLADVLNGGPLNLPTTPPPAASPAPTTDQRPAA